MLHFLMRLQLEDTLQMKLIGRNQAAKITLRLIKHLKTSIGGFRNPIAKPWESYEILPKPSPTIMLYRQNHTTLSQLKGYKTILFIKHYREQEIRNPYWYLKMFQKQWRKSQYWALQLKGDE